jgi:hypothetical protein
MLLQVYNAHPYYSYETAEMKQKVFEHMTTIHLLRNSKKQADIGLKNI